MNPRIKQLWIDALLSGEYLQIKGALHNDHGYCCLGVLCELYRKEHDNIYWIDREDTCEILNQSGTLPEEVQEWAGLSHKNPEVVCTSDCLNSLAELNDGGDEFSGFSFVEIARIISEQL